MGRSRLRHIAPFFEYSSQVERSTLTPERSVTRAALHLSLCSRKWPRDRHPMVTAPRQTRTLSSWKEIAAYLGKGVRTVQRWEQEFGLPVRRPNSTMKGVVAATPEELDDWLKSRWRKRPDTRGNGEKNGHINAAQSLRAERRDVMDQLLDSMRTLRAECEALADTAATSRRIRRGGAKADIR